MKHVFVVCGYVCASLCVCMCCEWVYVLRVRVCVCRFTCVWVHAWSSALHQQ